MHQFTQRNHNTSWRSDGSPSCLGGSSHGRFPVNTHSTPVLPKGRRLWVAQQQHTSVKTKRAQMSGGADIAPSMVAEHGCATTYDHDPVTSTNHHTSVQSVSQCDVGISKDLCAITETTWLRNPCASGNLKSSGETI